MEITSSPLANLTPRTPVDERLEKTRSPETGNRMHLPRRVESRTSSSAVQVRTRTKRSPSFSFMAILPLAMTLVKSDSKLRRMEPDAVEKRTERSAQVSSSSCSGSKVVMVSPSSSGRMFIIALPRACGEPSGSL